MKKMLKLFCFALVIFAGFVLSVKAETYTEEQAISRVEATEVKANELINVLTTWSNNFGDSVDAIISKSFLKKLNTTDYETQINLIIAELNSKGETAAANNLSSKKATILDKLSYIDETVDILEDYLKANKDGGVAGSTDLFIQLRATVRNLKTPLKNLVDIYYNKFYDRITSKINSYNTVESIRGLYDKMLEFLEDFDAVVGAVKSRSSTWQDLYNDYHLEDYEDFIKESIGDYYNKLNADYNKLYNKLETKLQGILDDKIGVIVDETDMSSTDSILARNDKLYDIMNYISDFKTEIEAKFDEHNAYIKIAKVKSIATKNQNKISDRLQEAYDYTESYIIDILKIALKNSSDKSYITLDLEKGIIIYRSKNLSATTFTNKFTATYGTLKTTNTYGSNVGTLSELAVFYNDNMVKSLTVIVKGDIDPNGKFSITDVVNLCDLLFGKAKLSNYQKMAADMNDDSKYTITDVVKLCDLLFN